MGWNNKSRWGAQYLSFFVVLFVALGVSIHFISREKKVEQAKQEVKTQNSIARKSEAQSKSVPRAKKNQFARKHKSKKVTLDEQNKKMAIVKKSRKLQRPRYVAQYGSSRRTLSHLGADSWNVSHEQVETLSDNIGDDPMNASGFENKKIEEDLSAAGM